MQISGKEVLAEKSQREGGHLEKVLQVSTRLWGIQAGRKTLSLYRDTWNFSCEVQLPGPSPVLRSALNAEELISHLEEVGALHTAAHVGFISLSFLQQISIKYCVLDLGLPRWCWW